MGTQRFFGPLLHLEGEDFQASEADQGRWQDLTMRLIRFVLARRHPDSVVEDGTFAWRTSFEILPTSKQPIAACWLRTSRGSRRIQKRPSDEHLAACGTTGDGPLSC
jgi:hypothetical protein